MCDLGLCAGTNSAAVLGNLSFDDLSVLNRLGGFEQSLTLPSGTLVLYSQRAEHGVYVPSPRKRKQAKVLDRV